MRHPTYKHLQARLRLGAFSLAQWAQIATAATCAVVFGVYLSPFSERVTIFVSIVAAGAPVAVSYGAAGHEFSVGQLAAALWRYLWAPRRYLPGPGGAVTGYLIEPSDSERVEARGRSRALEGEVLWDV